MSDYQPIACARYSELELHIMRRQRLRLQRVTEEGIVEERLLPRDLTTEAGAEYLHAERAGGDRLQIRLDAIVDFAAEEDQ
ncbi:transcriptional antiterminator, Rof [Endothiovibrio diazotrophicus]